MSFIGILFLFNLKKMALIPDNRTAPVTYTTDTLEDGLKEIGRNANGDPKFAYYGTPAVLVIRTEKVLGSLQDFKDKTDELQNSIINNDFWSGEVLTAVNEPSGDRIYVDNTLYYSGSLEYTIYPDLVTFVPPPVIRNYTTPANVSGYTITGEPIISFQGRQRTITDSYITTDFDNLPDSGSVVGDKLYTNVNRSNFREINDILYADVSLTYIELTGNYLVV